MNDFEHDLKKLRVRQVPEHWRAEILRKAQADEPNHQPWWAALLWPSPKAWGALGAAWVMMACFNAALRDGNAALDRPEAVQIRTAMEQKRKLQAEIEEAYAQARHQTPGPRSALKVTAKPA